MRGYWHQTSGLACDPRWARLSGCARGLLASLLDAADGPGEIDLHGMSALDVARAVLPHDDLSTVSAALAALQGARFVAVDEDLDALCVSLPRPNVAPPRRAPETSEAEPRAVAPGATERPEDPRRVRKILDAWASRYDLGTPEARAAWVLKEGASRVATLPASVVEEWVAAAGRRGGRFGHERSQHRSQHPLHDGANTGANVGSVHGASTGANTPSLSDSPSGEKDTEKEGDRAGRGGANTPAKDGANGANAHGANASSAEQIEEALTKRSSGRIDTLSAPASTRMALRSLLGEMGVDLPLAERMGELAANPTEVWPYLRDTSRVTLNFLVGKVDNNGVRAAGPLVELVSRARADLAARGPCASPEPPARSPARAAPMTDADTAEALRIAHEFAAARRRTPNQEPTHVP